MILLLRSPTYVVETSGKEKVIRSDDLRRVELQSTDPECGMKGWVDLQTKRIYFHEYYMEVEEVEFKLSRKGVKSADKV